MVQSLIRVVIVDDLAEVRAGLSNLLELSEDIVVVGEAADGSEALELASSVKPDVMLLDVELPVLRGDAVLRRLRVGIPAIKVLVVSAYTDGQYIRSMLSNGAAGYITKDEVPGLLLEAIHSIYSEKDKTWISPEVLKKTGTPLPITSQALSIREVEILEQLVLDQPESDIAATLGISELRVQRYLKLLMEKFSTPSLNSLKEVARHILPPKT